MLYDDDEWLNERVILSEVLERALQIGGYGGTPVRGHVLDELADHLGVNPSNLHRAAYEVLQGLFDAVTIDASEGGIWAPMNDILTDRHKRVAATAVEDCTVDDLLAATAQFGWRLQVKGEPYYGAVEKELQRGFAARLSDAIFKKMYDRWLKNSVWNQELARPRRLSAY